MHSIGFVLFQAHIAAMIAVTVRIRKLFDLQAQEQGGMTHTQNFTNNVANPFVLAFFDKFQISFLGNIDLVSLLCPLAYKSPYLLILISGANHCTRLPVYIGVYALIGAYSDSFALISTTIPH